MTMKLAWYRRSTAMFRYQARCINLIIRAGKKRKSGIAEVIRIFIHANQRYKGSTANGTNRAI